MIKLYNFDARNQDIVLNKANALCALKKYDDAISIFEKLLKKDIKNNEKIKNGLINAYVNKAIDAEKSGDLKTAIDLYEKSFRL